MLATCQGRICMLATCQGRICMLGMDLHVSNMLGTDLRVSNMSGPDVSQGRTCSDKFTCCHTEIKVAEQTFYLTRSRYTDTGPTSPSADPMTPDAWQGSHWGINFSVISMAPCGKRSRKNRTQVCRSRGGRLNR